MITRRGVAAVERREDGRVFLDAEELIAFFFVTGNHDAARDIVHALEELHR